METKKRPYDAMAVPKAVKRRRKAGPAPSTSSIVGSIVGESANAVASNVQSKVEGRHVVLENPKGKPSSLRQKQLKTRQQEAEKKARGNAKVLTVKRRESLPAAEEKKRWRFEDFEPLHELWVDYMTELLDLGLAKAPSGPGPAEQAFSGPPSAATMQAKLVKADYLGCRIKVAEAKNKALVGLEGTVIEETEGTFRIITPASKVKVLPKKHSVFSFEIPLRSASTSDASRSLSFRLHGNQFAFRSADRVNKKFKPHFVDL